MKKKDQKVIKSTNQFPVVGIGASAGGLEAFKKLLKAIPEDSGMAYVLVQHLDPHHESMLPELLQKVTKIPVLEISDDIKVEADHIYVIPSNKIMIANDGVLQLTPRPSAAKNKLNLPIDLFFKSLAEVHQTHAIGVVLSGTASDGTVGLKSIKDNGGITFAQDQVSAAYIGMPLSAVEAGVVDFVLPPEEIPLKILEIIKTFQTNLSEIHGEQAQDEEIFKQIISLLRIRKGIDFTYYKQTTIRRRILRRMALNKIEEPNLYLKKLRDNKAEQDILYQDLLIPVTSFFRDTASFDNLKDSIFPIILKNKTAGDSIRVWIAGCSTGEEAYSIAICLKEYLNDKFKKIQIFATDISDPAITKARTGFYPYNELDSVSELRLKEFFTKTNGGYYVNKEIRDMCVFANHNLLNDPPFGKLDLISCRNVLIYMEPYLQKKALTTFHYALNPKGFLFLGKSETISSVQDLFSLATKNDKIFSRKEAPGRFMHVASQRSEQNFSNVDANPKDENIRTDFQKTADEIILSKYTPAGVIVNDLMDIMHFRGVTSKYLEQSPGKPSHNLLKMAKLGLAFELRNLLHKSKKENKPIIKENIPLQEGTELRSISIEAIPLPNTIEPYYLILFHENNSFDNVALTRNNKKSSTDLSVSDYKDIRIQQLEKELAQTREDMRAITEDQEAANEELQSANEELLSSSEELQSLNEELETNKEELQSTNEELIVVNHEMNSLNEQITEARDYAEAIVATIREPLLVLDKNLKIKSANSSYYQSFKVNQEETEGNFIFDVYNKQWDIPALRTLLENILPEKTSFKNFEINLNFQNLGERIMLLNARELRLQNGTEKLILLVIEDITELRVKTIALQLKENELLNKDISARILEKEKLEKAVVERTAELEKVNKELIFQNQEKEKRASELIVANKELAFQNNEKEKRAQELNLANTELAFQNKEKEKKASELIIANKELAIQNKEKEKKAIELINANKELAFQNTEKEKRAIELMIVNKELESFAYVSSHDLQEPLRKIQTFAGRILEKENQNLSDTGKDYFIRMISAAKRMQQLIEDLLSFSRINMAERKFENTNLKKLIEDIKKELKDTIEEKNAIIEIKEMCKANIIPFQFRQLINNLLSNAFKFSRPNLPPHIVIESSIINGNDINIEKSNLPLGRITLNKNYCHVSVSDNGIGFEPQYSKRIFEVFQKLHRKEEYAGTGIGLAIVNKIVENHYGVITATSELGKGSRFDIYFPT